MPDNESNDDRGDDRRENNREDNRQDRTPEQGGGDAGIGGGNQGQGGGTPITEATEQAMRHNPGGMEQIGGGGDGPDQGLGEEHRE